jgi:hypothetical protein
MINICTLTFLRIAWDFEDPLRWPLNTSVTITLLVACKRPLDPCPNKLFSYKCYENSLWVGDMSDRSAILLREIALNTS